MAKYKKNSRRLLFGSGIGILVLTVLFFGLIRAFNPGPPTTKSSEPFSIPGANVVPSKTSDQTSKPPKPRAVHVQERHYSAKKYWQKFLKEYGPGLVPEFAPDGHFVLARNKPGEGAPADSDFSPEDPQRAIARAREILASAHDLLDLRQEWPLENAAARSGSISAQVFFNETHDGVQLAPVGGVKIDLGPHGELLGFYSDYASQVNITNQATLGPEQAKQKVPVVLSNRRDASSADRPIDGGGTVIWVSGASEGRIAYQFSSGGQEIVIDAETGNVLFTRDHRHY